MSKYVTNNLLLHTQILLCTHTPGFFVFVFLLSRFTLCRRRHHTTSLTLINGVVITRMSSSFTMTTLYDTPTETFQVLVIITLYVVLISYFECH